MCFLKSSKVTIPKTNDEVVKRQEADASLTKSSNKISSAYQQNIKTSPIGLSDNQNEEKQPSKKLLGE